MSSSETPGESSGTEQSGGKVFPLFAELRKRCGVIKTKKKEGVKFKVRSAEDLNDRIRPLADELGLLIYPAYAAGQAFVVEDGTLASVNLTLRIRAVVDGSYFDICGFGLGADTQDKAGGKAETYAWKAALVQALLAGGAEDSDDTDTPIPGGVRKKTGKPTVDAVKAAFDAATDKPGYEAAYADAKKLTMDDQKMVSSSFKACRERLGLATPAPTQH